VTDGSEELGIRDTNDVEEPYKDDKSNMPEREKSQFDDEEGLEVS